MKKQSLQDQLLNAGLTNNTKVKQLRSEKRKELKKQLKNKVEVVNEAKQLAQEAKARQQEKDKELNKKQNIEAEIKQIDNQITQLINLNKLPKDDKGIAYNFTDQNKIKTIYISEEIRKKIIAGNLAIVKFKSGYEVVPIPIADKIKIRKEQVIIVQFSEKLDEIEEKEYQEHKIPDDLIW